MIFSYVQNPRYKDINIQFICGKEKVFSKRQYVVGDYIEDYWETDVLLGEYKNKHGEWLDYWVLIRNGQLVGVEMKISATNKFDIAVKYGLPKIYKAVKNSVIKKKGK
jgi:hypothetical protein